MGAALEPGADGAVLAGDCARAGDAGGPARHAGVPAAARARVGSHRWTAATLAPRAGATGRQLYAAFRGAGVCDRAPGRAGGRRDPAGAALAPHPAWTGAGPGQGIRAADPAAAAARSAVGEPGARLPWASRRGGAVARGARRGA